MGGKGSGRAKPSPMEVYETDPNEFVVSEKMGNIMEVVERLGDQAESVMLNEWNPERKKREYLMTIPVEQFSLDYVREQFGGGEYIALFLDEKGKTCGGGAFTISKKFVGKIGALVAPDVPGGRTTDPATAIALAQMSGQAKGLEVLIQSQGVMMQGLLTALAGKKEQGQDPLDVGLRIAEIIKGSGGNGPSVKELVSDMAETFRDGIKFGQLAHAPVEKGLADILDPLIPSVGKALEAAASQGKVLPAAPSPKQPKGEAPAVDVSKAPWLVHLRPFINEIAAWAKNGWDAEAYIGSMVARLPDHVLDEIEVASRSATFIEDALASLPAPFMAYKAWLTKALTALKETVTPDPNAVEEDEEEESSMGGA
jgi:hypothetical protein